MPDPMRRRTISFAICFLILLAAAHAQSGMASTDWVAAQGYSTGGGVPSGLIVLTLTSCPSGFSEVSALDGKFLQGTLAAHSDVGTTGGNATITPAGTVSQPTFTGASDTTSAVSAGTPAGTNSTTTTGATSAGTPAGTNGATATSGNCAATNIAAGTGSTTACKATAPNLTVPAETFTGSALATHTHTVPAETFTGSALATHTHTVTPTGTVSQPTFTGNSVDPRPPFVKVIFCSKN